MNDKEKGQMLCRQLLELLELPKGEEQQLRLFIEEHSIQQLLEAYPSMNLAEDTKAKLETISELLT
ncbi:hypothetical protein EDD76_108214 [Kineothrix alysoides]|uniref:Uncharacterized protein n=1 Tax=Kineothrix alysoides TaxID=1469948 RepID=A0A4R1QUN0_9FIRM|nr:hypothetical protein [Kineothrix alysoides]TCL57679.1 hypothetical protein EDD76_108214 [Kineothrix alysoides]